MTTTVDEQMVSELTGGERLLWSGRPHGGWLLRPLDALIVPAAFASAIGAFFAVSSAIGGDRSPAFWLALLPIGLLSLAPIAARTAMGAVAGGRTAYAVTDRRIIVVDGLWGRRVTSLPLSTLQSIVLTEQGGRRGTIRFGSPASPFAALFGASAWSEGDARFVPSFERIDDARAVHELILRAQAAHSLASQRAEF